MDDLISRQAAIDAIEEYADRLQILDWKENPGVPYKAYALNWCINTIRDLPSAQPEPVRHGKWIDIFGDNIKYGTCSLCGDMSECVDTMNYCSNCGARMDAERKDNG